MYRSATDVVFDAARMLGIFVPIDLTVDIVAQHLGLHGEKGSANYGSTEVYGRVTSRQLESVAMAKNFIAQTPEMKLQVLDVLQPVLEARASFDGEVARKVFVLLEPQA